MSSRVVKTDPSRVDWSSRRWRRIDAAATRSIAGSTAKSTSMGIRNHFQLSGLGLDLVSEVLVLVLVLDKRSWSYLSDISKSWSWSCPFGLDLSLGLVIKILLTSLAIRHYAVVATGTTASHNPQSIARLTILIISIQRPTTVISSAEYQL